MFVYTSGAGIWMRSDILALTLRSKTLSSGENSLSFSLLRPPYSTGRFSGDTNLVSKGSTWIKLEISNCDDISKKPLTSVKKKAFLT